jgi:hydrogenase expression/formation protein HypD
LKYIAEYRNPVLVSKLADKIWALVSQNWSIMEICGGQTHAIMKYNISELLPPQITLIHGPGCPVCVTPLEMIDKALFVADMDDVILASFGDMVRVPGSKSDLLKARAEGADVRIVYSPLDAVKIAIDNPSKKVVFFAIGFETTAPANALSVLQAAGLGISNYSLLCAHVLVPPALETILSSGNACIDGLLAPGHVCLITGYDGYIPIARKYGIPIAVTGFEPVDILKGIYEVVKQLESGEHIVRNCYERTATQTGNSHARKNMYEVFEVCDRQWRGIGLIPDSGLKVRDEFALYDAEKVFDLGIIQTSEPEECIAGLVLQGRAKPSDCPVFGTVCNPEHPLGAPMVSSEGACSAYFRYHSNQF